MGACCLCRACQSAVRAPGERGSASLPGHALRLSHRGVDPDGISPTWKRAGEGRASTPWDRSSLPVFPWSWPAGGTPGCPLPPAWSQIAGCRRPLPPWASLVGWCECIRVCTSARSRLDLTTEGLCCAPRLTSRSSLSQAISLAHSSNWRPLGSSG